MTFRLKLWTVMGPHGLGPVLFVAGLYVGFSFAGQVTGQMDHFFPSPIDGPPSRKKCPRLVRSLVPVNYGLRCGSGESKPN